MPLHQCPECGGAVSSHAPACPHCGFAPPAPPQVRAQRTPPREAPHVMPSWPAVAAILCLPLLMMIGHTAAFDANSTGPLVVLALLAIVAACPVVIMDRLRNQRPKELARSWWANKPIRYASLGMVAVAEFAAVGMAMREMSKDRERSAERVDEIVEERERKDEEASQQRAADRRKAKKAIEEAWTALGQINEGTGAPLATKKASQFCELVAGATKLDVMPVDAAQAKAFCDEAEKLAGQITDRPPRKPQPPEAPELELPEYQGSERIRGTIRGPYQGGGVVIETGGKLLLLEDASMPRSPLVTFLHGYADDTGRTVTLNVGRSGRTARVLSVKDKETYEDDRARHREAVAQARKDHAQALKDFARSRANYPDRLKEYEEDLAEHEAAVEQAKADLVQLVVDFAE